MAVVITHTKVSAIADDPVAAAAGEVLPSHWNANHSLSGVGTMAEQNANAVAITGGAESGVTHSGDTIGTYLDHTAVAALSASVTTNSNDIEDLKANVASLNASLASTNATVANLFAFMDSLCHNSAIGDDSNVGNSLVVACTAAGYNW